MTCTVWPHHQSNTASQPKKNSCWGTKNSAKSGEYGGWSTTSKPQSHTAVIWLQPQTCVQESWWNWTPCVSSCSSMVSFPCHSWTVSSTTFQSHELLTFSVDLSGRKHCSSTVEPLYNEVLGTMKITLLYQVSHYRVKKQRNIKCWDQQNYLVIRGFCYIRPRYNEVPLYQETRAKFHCCGTTPSESA